MKLFAKNGFVVNVVMMDTEFEKVSNKIGNTEANTTAAREQVGETERGISVVKEMAQCIFLTLPLKLLHNQI